MDDEWIKQLLQGEIFWYETRTFTSTASSFVPYSNTVASSCNNNINGANSENMNKKMIGFLKKSWPTTTTTTTMNEIHHSEKERCFRHMMNERMRREKQKRSYFALHSMLPHGTKTDKNSIVETATMRVQELEWLKKDLERRNYELQANYREGNKIRVKIENPTSGIDSMLEALKCLKALDSKPRMIHSKFSTQQFLAIMDFETQKGAAKVEEAVNRTLQETERKLQGCPNVNTQQQALIKFSNITPFTRGSNS